MKTFLLSILCGIGITGGILLVSCQQSGTTAADKYPADNGSVPTMLVTNMDGSITNLPVQLGQPKGQP